VHAPISHHQSVAGFSRWAPTQYTVQLRGPYHFTTVRTCFAHKPYSYNRSFTCRSGKQWFRQGELRFPDEREPAGVPGGDFLAPGDSHSTDRCYRTRFGPTACHNGRIYGADDVNMRYALRRLTAAREPERPGSHQRLFAAQSAFIKEHWEFITNLQRLYEPTFRLYRGWREECAEHYADPHPKRALRITAYDELAATGRIHDRLWCRSVLYKLKRDEIAKHGKYARAIADLGVAASLQGFRSTEFLKRAQEQIYGVRGGFIQFVKTPDTSILQGVFNNLIQPSGRFYFCCFSDDSCLAVRGEEGVRRFNLDISSCDASHGPGIFNAFIHLFPGQFRDDARILVEQCGLPIRIQSYSDPRRRVVLEPKFPMLYSGSTITTCINNLASMLIAYAVSRVVVFTPDAIIRAARDVGYIITLEECTLPEDLQFLKYSPVRDVRGVYRPVLNLGVLLRASGTCRGDLPGRAHVPLEERAAIFQSALLAGLYPATDFTLIRNMRRGLPAPRALREVAQFLEHRVLATTMPPAEFRDEDLYLRYRLLGAEIEVINNDFGGARFGEHMNHPVLGKILKRDYGLTHHVLPFDQTLGAEGEGPSTLFGLLRRVSFVLILCTLLLCFSPWNFSLPPKSIWSRSTDVATKVRLLHSSCHAEAVDAREGVPCSLILRTSTYHFLVNWGQCTSDSVRLPGSSDTDSFRLGAVLHNCALNSRAPNTSRSRSRPRQRPIRRRAAPVPAPRAASRSRSRTRKTVAMSVPIASTRAFAATGPPRISERKDSKAIHHIELFGTIETKVSTFQVIYSLPLNPGNASLFPWLSKSAVFYEFYRIKDVVITYTSRCGALSTGSIAIMPDYDPTDPPPKTLVEGMTYADAKEMPVWTPNFEVRLDTKRIHSLNPRKLTIPYLPDQPLQQSHGTIYDGCVVHIAISGGATTGVTLGNLHVKYAIELSTPQAVPSAIPLAAGIGGITAWKMPTQALNLPGTPAQTIVVPVVVEGGADAPTVVDGLNLGPIRSSGQTIPLAPGTYQLTVDVAMEAKSNMNSSAFVAVTPIANLGATALGLPGASGFAPVQANINGPEDFSLLALGSLIFTVGAVTQFYPELGYSYYALAGVLPGLLSRVASTVITLQKIATVFSPSGDAFDTSGRVLNVVPYTGPQPVGFVFRKTILPPLIPLPLPVIEEVPEESKFEEVL